MNTKTYISIALFFVSLITTAQIDRTKQPEPGPAPKIELEKPEKFTLDNGITVMIVEDNVLPRVSYSLRIENNPIVEGEKSGVSNLLAAMLGNGSTAISKDEFNEEIDFMGANLNFGSQGAFASGLSRYAERILELMADAAINPLFTQEEFEKEKVKLIEGLKLNDKSVDAVASRVGGALSYGTQHSYGEFVTEETVNNITLDDVQSFYNDYFNPNNTYLVVVGDLEDDRAKKLAKKYFGNWKSSTTKDITLMEPNPNVAKTEINFIDMPNAVQSNISVTNNVKLKMDDEDYYAVLVANSILGGNFSSYLNMNLREANGYTYGARSNVAANRFGASRFTASAAVRNEVTDSAVVETLKEIKRLRTELVDPEKLSTVKAKYVGDFVLALERPQTIANYALNVELNDLDGDYYKDYLKNINAVSAEDVLRVANSYFTPDNARIIIVGKGSEVLDNLEKTGIPIVYYDPYARPTKKPVFSKPIPEGITAASIMSSYIKAIGGEEAVSKVTSMFMAADVNITGVPMPLKAEMKSMAPNKESLELTAEGMGVLVKEKFNGASGYSEQQGMRKDFTEEQLVSKKASKSLFPERHFSEDQMMLESATTINDKNVFKVKTTVGDKDSYRYYDADSGLLVKTETTQEVQGKNIVSTVDYTDYKAVDGIMVPMTLNITNGPAVINFKVNAVEINKVFTEEDFE